MPSPSADTISSSAPATNPGAHVPLLVGLLFGLTGLGSSSAAIVLPTIGSDLHVSIGIGAWAISLYALMLAVATAVYGRVSDLVGQRLPLLVGVTLMTVGALGGALAPNFGFLLAARIVQGAGAAAVPTLGVAIVTARFTGSARGVALGRVAGTAAAVSCLGPLAGGTIEGLLGWRAVIALPMLGALMLPLLWRWVPTNGSGARLDLFGAALVRDHSRGRRTAGAVAVDRTRRGRGRSGAGRGRRTRRRRLGTPPAQRLPAGRGDPQRRRGAQCPGRRSSPRRVVRAAHRRARRPGRSRLGALAGRRGADPERRHRTAVAALRRTAAQPDRPHAVPRAARPWSPPRRWVSRPSVRTPGPAVLLVTAVVGVTFAFGLGQPALMEAVGDAVAEDVRGVALGIATLFFLVGGGVGSAVVGGLGDVLGMAPALLLLAALPLVGLAALVPQLLRPAPVSGRLVDLPSPE